MPASGPNAFFTSIPGCMTRAATNWWQIKSVGVPDNRANNRANSRANSRANNSSHQASK